MFSFDCIAHKIQVRVHTCRNEIFTQRRYVHSWISMHLLRVNIIACRRYLCAVAQLNAKDKHNVGSKEGQGQVEVDEVVYRNEQILPA